MNVTGVLILLMVIGFVFFFTEKMVKRGRNSALVARKILHIAGVGGLAISPVFFNNHLLLAVVAGFFGVILYFAVKRKLLAADLYHRESLGIALFPFAFLALWLLWGQSAPHLVIYPMLVLALSDAAAAIFGGLFGKKKYRISGDEKSYLGSFAFVCTTFLTLWFLPGILEGLDPIFRLELPGVILLSDKIIIILLISLVAAGFEGSTSGGWDNVSVPFSVAWLLALLPMLNAFSLYWALPVLAGLAGLGVIAWQKKWLDAGGSVTAAILGLVIWLGGNWAALILIGLFFLTGSLLSKLNKGEQVSAKLGKARDYRQVLCNGGVAGACMVWYAITLNSLPLAVIRHFGGHQYIRYLEQRNWDLGKGQGSRYYRVQAITCGHFGGNIGCRNPCRIGRIWFYCPFCLVNLSCPTCLGIVLRLCRHAHR
jgi:dolichol kinase